MLNPKEEAFSNTINSYYDKCEILQAEKCGLSEKAYIVLERQIRRLDVGLRSLSAREEFPSDWGGPSLLSGSATGVSTPATGGGGAAAMVGGPLQAVSHNIIGSANGGPGAPNIANVAQMRLAQATSGSSRPLHLNASGGGGHQTPPSNPRSQRESSSEASKRRRLNASLGSLPTASSNLRQSSLGPGTPKAGTPGPTTSSSSQARVNSTQPPRPLAAGQKRAGTLPQPPTAGTSQRKVAPHQQQQALQATRKRDRTSKKTRDRRRQLARGTPSTAASPSPSSELDDDSSLPRSQADGTLDTHRRGEGEDEDEDNDDQLYCYCQKVSFGNMVGCDNDNCEYQWFHWECVGLKSEPEGEWLCPTCRKLGRDKVVISKG